MCGICWGVRITGKNPRLMKKITSKSVLQRDICRCYSSIMYCLWRLRIINACKLLELFINTMSFQNRSARCERHATIHFLILLKALKVPNLECVCFKPCCLGSRARFQRYFVSVDKFACVCDLNSQLAFSGDRTSRREAAKHIHLSYFYTAH